MPRKKVPIFDIKTGTSPEIDVEGFFHLSRLEPISHNRDTLWVDDIRSGEDAPVHDFSLSKELTVYRYRTLSTLDLLEDDVADLQASSITKGPLREGHTLLINPPLRTPYGSLDVRKGGSSVLGRKYADLFTRRLPFWLSLYGHYRLYHKTIFTWLARGAFFIAGLLLLALPLLAFIRFSLEGSVHLIEKLPHISSNKELIDTTRDIRAGFERSKLLVTPYRLLFDNRIIHIDEIRALGGFIDAGTSLSRGLHTLSSTLDPNFEYKGQTETEEDETPLTPVWRGESKDIFPLERYGIDKPTEWIREHHETIKRMVEDLSSISQRLGEVDFIDNSRLEKYKEGGALITLISRLGRLYLDNTSHIMTILGDEVPERYLVLNQNQDELRANGGFPGSVITFTLYKGNLLDIRKDDVYYYDWNLFPYKEVPPPGLALLSNNFGLRDVNYYPIFRESVEKANEFIEKSGDSTITTGIAINQGIVIDLLKDIGPITLTGIMIPINAENFSSLLSTLVEAKHAKLISPKDILFEFIDAMGRKIVEKKNYLRVAETIEKSLLDGEIRIASRDDDIQNWLDTIGFSEKWLTSSGNWIYPVFTSLSGNKSDRYMTRNYSGTTSVLTGCTMENAVTLRSSHRFSDTQKSEIEGYLDMIGIIDKKDREKLLFIQGNGPNKHYMRLIVPKGSSLISQGPNIEYTEGERYGTIAFMLETPVGGTSEKTIRYRTTPKNCSEKLEWYRQPGLANLKIEE